MWNDPPGGFHPVSAPDYLPREQLESIQLQRLQSVVARAYDNVALFRSRMDERDLTPASIRRLADIADLPFTVKTDLRDTYPFGLFASPMEEIVRLHASSGTTGKPIVVAYTQADLDVWAEVMVRSFAACGIHRGDVIQNAYGYGLFTGGLGAHYGAELLGATVIPISGGNTERQLMVMQDFGVTAICCTPSYFLHLVEAAREMKIDFSRLRVGVFGAEPWSEAMRERIQEDSGIRAHDIYGLSEIIGPGVGIECVERRGLHIFEDHFYPEIVDPEIGRGAAGRRRRRARPHDPVQAGHADDPLPDPRRDGSRVRAMRLRPNAPPHPAHRPAIGRHGHHSRRQRLPLAGRDGASAGRRHAAALSHRPDPRQGPRPDGSQGRSDAGGLLRRDPQARSAPAASWRPRSRTSWACG